jgi:hypothetical protein
MFVGLWHEDYSILCLQSTIIYHKVLVKAEVSPVQGTTLTVNELDCPVCVLKIIERQ